MGDIVLNEEQTVSFCTTESLTIVCNPPSFIQNTKKYPLSLDRQWPERSPSSSQSSYASPRRSDEPYSGDEELEPSQSRNNSRARPTARRDPDSPDTPLNPEKSLRALAASPATQAHHSRRHAEKEPRYQYNKQVSDSDSRGSYNRRRDYSPSRRSSSQGRRSSSPSRERSSSRNDTTYDRFRQAYHGTGMVLTRSEREAENRANMKAKSKTKAELAQDKVQLEKEKADLLAQLAALKKDDPNLASKDATQSKPQKQSDSSKDQEDEGVFIVQKCNELVDRTKKITKTILWRSCQFFRDDNEIKRGTKLVLGYFKDYKKATTPAMQNAFVDVYSSFVCTELNMKRTYVQEQMKKSAFKAIRKQDPYGLGALPKEEDILRCALRDVSACNDFCVFYPLFLTLALKSLSRWTLTSRKITSFSSTTLTDV